MTIGDLLQVRTTIEAAFDPEDEATIKDKQRLTRLNS